MCNPIGPTKLLQSIWLDKSNPWSDIISLHSVKWYQITSRVSFLFTPLSHWYPHIICNKNLFDWGSVTRKKNEGLSVDCHQLSPYIYIWGIMIWHTWRQIPVFNINLFDWGSVTRKKNDGLSVGCLDKHNGLNRKRGSGVVQLTC